LVICHEQFAKDQEETKHDNSHKSYMLGELNQKFEVEGRILEVWWE